ncbi:MULTISPECIES: crotonase/enoyl-CoA hydratase family protein [Stenotrophomonas]|jgi:DSF synthase|uniref:Crotonase/enoyl-CoA hydratase family protein n=1 Tax=Stenotrophomonas pavanii TaxID=487698 RepID=A0ABM7R273_9GAMM|nr:MULTISPECIES: crotonase/enoyl-CoA hydratase family protein [Stenotrophomonas]MBC9081534.1 crotonase/enoyl-CoA hydratase family protein [Stenotrophomonas maltophilia]MBC9090598.1 crotonase/enoyl-CoA hydratase family protein [Stenotrophomonas maltophilia]MBH1389788.1 crotonase/enoyl-CoA hydratase family protein [Stenotrophomonas maltophilia]MBH1521884.1 crotonase/enoyl-CoA hydratase family protein [Stenotrophomonas maltophilia]MCF3465340.1 enoyl-CoA hydratase [Stenotrophomonas maltophilia]
MSTIEKLPSSGSPFATIRTEDSADGAAHWLFMHADAATGIRPCCRKDMLDEMWSYMAAITRSPAQRHNGTLRHFVLASDAVAYNLGGDLDLFTRLIREGNRDLLLNYAQRCVEGVHHLHTGFGGDVRSIALIQGDALGGGLEMALACHTIVAEEGCGLGLPEVLFGLFPGMGAYSFLCRRVSPHLAEKIILDGRVYSAEEMHAMGVVDVLVKKGEGRAAVEELIRQQQRTPQSYLAMNAARAIAQPVSYDELLEITKVWVDSALALGDRSLRTMDRLIKAQTRRASLDAA